MTIENKLRCYLFYELQVAFWNKWDEDENLSKRGIMVVNAEDWFYNEDKFGILEISNAKESIITRHGFNKRKVKPILRSMDDLNKPLSDGSIPLEVIRKMRWHTDDARASSEILEYLYLHHFDVHGLIEDKIAVDEKTLK